MNKQTFPDDRQGIGESLRKNTIGYAAHIMIYVCALSVFLPYYLSATVIMLTGLSFCVLPGTRDKIFCHKGSFLLLAFAVMTAIVAAFYGNHTGLIRTGVFVMMMVVTLVARGLATKRFYERLLDCFIIGGCFSTVGCIIERIVHSDEPGYRCKAFFTNPNFFGTAIMLVILICAYKAVTHSKRVYLYYIAAVFNAVSIYLCGSMGLWFVLFIGILILLILNHEYKLLAVFMAIVACICVAIVMIPELVPRLNELLATTNNRVKIWSFAVEQIKEAPIFGRGFFSYRFLYNEMVAVRPELYKAALCHNLLFESMLSFGIVGTAMIGFYLIGFFRTILHNHDELKRRGHRYAVTTFIAALSVAIACYGMIDTTVIWVQTGMIILLISSGIGVDERELRHLHHIERSKNLHEQEEK